MADPRHAQRQAADPKASIFVTANAGSGKTTTLVDRVARLLLGGSTPEAILCVTYTKAAAAEMQRRLFQRLGDWSVMQDEDLRRQLAALQGMDEDVFAPPDLSAARALFARALETPGWLKIQTIHAFCEKLLKRFPLEAGVSPGFKVMDDRDADEIAGEARERVAELVQVGPSVLADAYARLSVALAFDDFQAMFTAFETHRAAIADYLERCGGQAAADVWRRCGFEGPTSEADVEAEALSAIDFGAWRAAAEILHVSGGKTDDACAEKLKAAAASGAFADALAVMFTEGGDGTPATWVEKTSGLKSREDLRQRLLADQDHLEGLRERRCAARIGEDTVHALILAQAYVDAYAGAKRTRGALDFADLILKTCELLTRRADAAWVLYKLDGGIDHILLDEAQDTAPEQWAILRALTSEFFAGEGAAGFRLDQERTLFIVGDEKQSIYSFQGADPERLRVETATYHAEIQAIGRRSAHVPLIASFRSTPQVLGFVDAVFADRDVWQGVPAPSGEAVVRHLAMRGSDSGCVDLWPLMREEPGEEREAWDEPLDLEGAHSANRRLAEKIAAEIQALVARGDAVFDKDARVWRGAHFGDVLILVRRRRALFEEILRALKRRGVPVAGADRLSLSAHIAFDDLMALARFVQFEDDDLTLAALLKAPFLGLGEDDLFRLAHGRTGSLWRTLQARAEEAPRWAEALAFLRRCRTEGRARRPFDFFSRLFGWTDGQGRSVRARILTRLGAEAEEVLHEFLAQVLAAERAGIVDLERLVQDFTSLDITVKREMEGARGEVRVMTVHGAKGLEAPIVFLPETTLKRTARGSALLRTAEGGFLWAPTKKADCAASRQAREAREVKEEHEAQRLFYVALTRARDRLVLAGRINARDKIENVGGWYAAAEAAFGRPEIAPLVRTLDGEVRRFGPDPARAAPHTATASEEVAPPGWVAERPASESAPRFVSPSRLGDEEADLGPAPSPLAEAQGLGRWRRGDLIHRLLQLLPDIAPVAREAAARRLLARERDLTETQRAEMAAAALGVLNDDRFAAVFGPGSRAEVAVAGLAPGVGPISGRVDRLLVDPGRVLVIDFKTNRPAPSRIEDADGAYLRQMAVYVAVLQTLFPDRRVEAALVWTDGPRLMPVPENLTAEALSGLARSVDT
ncbi:MAG: double-strand break repair helicase AddA [Caulobacteraceae bacterium]